MAGRCWSFAVASLAALWLLVATPAGAAASAQPVLFTLGAGKAATLTGGAQKAWPIKVDENAAMAAVFAGGMWLPNPEGGRIYAKYRRHILHANGTWTWIGTVSTVHGQQSVVLTFGKDATFGFIPQASGWPLQISTAHGQTRVIATSAQALARSQAWLRLHTRPDAIVPPRTPRMAPAASAQAVAATAAAPVTIDVMVAYTPGLVTVYGSESAALTRIQYLVDWTNQAYVNSNVYQQIRLVHTVEVDYPDNTTDTQALTDITGNDGSGPAPIPASLQGIAALRVQYGADLVALLRPFDAVADAAGECGVGWLNGSNGDGFDAMWGYSTVSDKADSSVTDNYYCGVETFAHELGHNMGDAHDRANATDQGAYPYSYGYLGNGLHGFSTIMAYGTANDTPMQVFSNPDISTCQGTPCGVADDSASSADNAHSMNNTAAIVAAFEPTATGPGGSRAVHNDIDGDGKSDILFMNRSTGQFVYWLMHGAQFAGWRGFSAGPPWQVIATGDFNADGHADLLWQGAGSLHVWLGDGSGGFVDRSLVAAPPAGWQVIGTGDIDGDGCADIFWYNPGTHQLVFWYIKGGAYSGYGSATVPAGFIAGGVGDLDGDGHADLVWTDASGKLYVWLGNGSGSFTQDVSNATVPAGWQIAGIGDVDGDGKDDILWTQPATGGLEYYLMNGSQMTASKSWSAGSAYAVAGVGDFDGDGMADILWTSSGGDLWMWLHSSPTTYAGSKVRAYPAGWSILP